MGPRSCFYLLLFLATAHAAEKRDRALPPAVVFGRVAPSTVVVQAGTGGAPSQGSGVVIAAQLVVTNHHVVANRQSFTVRRGERSWSATLEAFDPKHDLALLRVPDLDAPRVVVRATESVQVGERVYAVGAPHGLELSLSDGLVSALRERDGAKVIQTTAPVSPGSSGGGLYDTSGRLIGVITFTRGGQNLNFAHPTEWIDELRGAKGGKRKPTSEAPRFSVATRPKRLTCALGSSAEWGLFSGGAEMLEAKAAEGSVDFRDFEGQLPSAFVEPALAKKNRFNLVLDDLDRTAGYLVFGTREAGPTSFYLVQDAEGRFNVSIVTASSFYGRIRFDTMSGPCSVPKPRKRRSRVKTTTRTGPARLTRCVGQTVTVTLRDGPQLRGDLRLFNGVQGALHTRHGLVVLRAHDVLSFTCEPKD